MNSREWRFLLIMKKKKNNFLLLCFSLIPGAGQMYLGFMKTGISLMSLFGLTIALTIYTNIGVLAFSIVVVWAYGFFHANNLGRLSDEEFDRMEDVFLFGLDAQSWDAVKTSVSDKYRKVIAGILIILGVSMLWQTFCDLLRFVLGDDFYFHYVMHITSFIANKVPRFVIGLAIVWFGIQMIRGKKARLDHLELLEDRKEENSGAEDMGSEK